MLKKILHQFKDRKTKNFLIYGFGQAFNLLTPLLIMPFIVYHCGEEGLGKTGVSLSLMFILIVIVDYGSYIKGVKEVSINRNDRQKLQQILSTVYTLKFFLLLAVCGIAIPLIFLLPYFEGEQLLFLMSLLIIVGQFVNPGWFLQGIENFTWITITNIASKLLYVLGVLLFVHDKGDYIYVNMALGLGAIFGNALGIVWILKEYRTEAMRLDMQAVKEAFRSDFKFCISQLFLSLRQYAPIIIIGFLCGNFVAGQYKIIEQIIMFFRTYLQMFFRFIYGNICFEINQNRQKGIEVWKKNNAFNIALIVFLALVLYVSASTTLKFFKIDLSHLEALKQLLRFSLIIPVLLAISNPMEQLMFVFEKNKAYINITILLTFFNLILMAFAVNLFDLYGAIVSVILTELIIIGSYYLYIKQDLQPNKV